MNCWAVVAHAFCLVFYVIVLFSFYVYWCFAYMHVCVRVLNPLELELQTVVSCHVGAET